MGTGVGISKSIDWPHEKIHEGKHYTFTYSKALSAGSVLSVAITTPTSDVGIYHFVAAVESNLAGTWYFTEGASISGGSALTAYNNNRISSNTSGSTIKGSPTVTTYGTVYLETHSVGSNTTPHTLGGNAEVRNEYILASSTTYMLYFQANATSTYAAITSAFYIGG